MDAEYRSSQTARVHQGDRRRGEVRARTLQIPEDPTSVSSNMYRLLHGQGQETRVPPGGPAQTGQCVLDQGQTTLDAALEGRYDIFHRQGANEDPFARLCLLAATATCVYYSPSRSVGGAASVRS